jgi:hypothetical protein
MTGNLPRNAERIYRSTAKHIPAIIERDARGLDMAMWF